MQRERNVILATAAGLLSFGIVMVYSSSATVAGELAHFGDPFFFLKRQAMWVLFAVGALAAFAATDYRRWTRWATPLLVITAVCLVLVLIPGVGRSANGARRWLRLGPINVQPSELAKIALLLYAAAYGAAGPERLASFRRGLLPGFAVLGTVCGLVLMEPDVGTTLFLGGLVLAMWMVGGARWRSILPLGGAALAAAVLLAVTRFDHVLARVRVFIDPSVDPQGRGYHLLQSQIAVGSGGWTGVGLGESRLKLFFLPERHTEFIFAIVGEETGFLGAAAVVAAFAVLLVCGWRICRAAPDRLGLLLSFGALAIIIGQAVVNMAVVTGLMPTKGIGLPFVSYGGSSLVVSAACVGILCSVARGTAMSRIQSDSANENSADSVGERMGLRGTPDVS
jgi:cell division protein FtsW